MLLPRHGQTVERILPDGCADLVATSEGIQLWGPASAAIVAPSVREARIGVRFRPGGVRILFGAEPGDLRDQRAPAVDVLGRRLRASLEESVEERVDGLSLRRLLSRVDRLVHALANLRREGEPDPLVRAALQRLDHDPALRTGALARGFDISERQLRRRFEAETGLGVKRMARILRFQRLLSRIRDAQVPAAGWAEIAGELGYSDQAHLIHETRLMSGLSPHGLEKELRSAPDSEPTRLRLTPTLG